MRTPDEIQADAVDQRPFSNMTEFEYWAGGGKGCWDCLNDDEASEKYCPILTVAVIGSWPKEWLRRTVNWKHGDASGSYEAVGDCTEFEERRDDGPDEGDPQPVPGPSALEMEGQIDMFEVFADRIADEASTVRPAEVTG